MTPRSSSLLLRGLVMLGAFTFLEAAHANPCEATAILSGEPALVAELSAMLAQRSISLQGLPGCAAISASVSSQGKQLVVILQDTSGKSETFQVAELATAASLIEAWSRVALEPILPPGIEASAAAALVEAAPAAPVAVPQQDDDAMPSSIDPYAPVLQQTVPRQRFHRYHQFTQWTQAAENPWSRAQGGKFQSLEVSGEYLPGGIDSSGRGLKVSINAADIRRLDLSIEGRGHQKTSGNNDSMFFNTTYNPADPTLAKTLFQGVDLMLRLSLPLQVRRFALVPSVAAGVGYHTSQDLVANLEIPEDKALRGLVDGQLGLEYRLTPRLAVEAYYSLSFAQHHPYQDGFAKDATTGLNPMPNVYERLGAGLSFHF